MESESNPPRRILIYGCTGSGKTSLAQALARELGMPWTEVDELTWQPGWVEVPLDEQRARIAEICAGDSWLLDTAYGKWLEVPLERATVIVGLDYPRRVSTIRLLRRTFDRLVRGTRCCNGNSEDFRQTFSRNSILMWHFKSFPSKRRRIAKFIADGRPVIHVTRPAPVDQLASELATKIRRM